MSPVPDPVRRFIEAAIDSVPELECLLLLYRFEDHSWTADELAERLYLSPEVASAIVTGLKSKRVVTAVNDTEVVRYRFKPETAELRETTIQLEQAYRSHLMLVTQMIHSKAPRAVLEFARAFRVTKEKK